MTLEATFKYFAGLAVTPSSSAEEACHPSTHIEELIFDPLYPQVNNESPAVLQSSQAAESLCALFARRRRLHPSRVHQHLFRTRMVAHLLASRHPETLPQTSHLHATPLEVGPKPDIVTRVCGDELVQWEGAFGSVDIWKGVAGVDRRGGGMGDEVFRVVEWGGLEVGRWACGEEAWAWDVCYGYFYEMGEVPLMYEWRLSLLFSTFACVRRMAQKSLRDEGGVMPAFSFHNHTQLLVHKNVSHTAVRMEKKCEVSMNHCVKTEVRDGEKCMRILLSAMSFYVAIKDDAEFDTSEKRCKNYEKPRGASKVLAR
ncbi:hypothetical protein EDD18DRAFT_1420126 [Armillaria luteobubalina]|uniref:Uncharacterized protein n=1 Tax=Armillaria luteobubalina TaxID=153913 RepID=A0AA39PS79_9AGAR|nr:hypothetical protein EDD18DRAFT_1420126 [Armillaria luteobubalina]